MRLLKLIGILLDYPVDDLWANRDDILSAVDDPAVPANYRADLLAFVHGLLDNDYLQIQSEWIETFDRGRTMSLLLFEHIHGESRDRGQAMVDLTNAYQAQGFQLNARELPDYLPLVLEFLSFQKADFVKDWLVNISYILALLATRAKSRNSRYQVLFNILVELSGTGQDWQSIQERVAEEKPDYTPQAMDAVWMEAEVKFGPDNGPTSACKPAAFNQPKRIRPRNKGLSAKQETN